MEIICVPAIVSIVYAVVELYKKTIAKDNSKLIAIIPIIALVLGGGLGVGTFYLLPQIIVANTWYMALIVGMVSGLSATGCNQIFKQLKKYGIEVKEQSNDKSERK